MYNFLSTLWLTFASSAPFSVIIKLLKKYFNICWQLASKKSEIKSTFFVCVCENKGHKLTYLFPLRRFRLFSWNKTFWKFFFVRDVWLKTCHWCGQNFYYIFSDEFQTFLTTTVFELIYIKPKYLKLISVYLLT